MSNGRDNGEERDRIVVYTDGACSGNPGPGGWGWVVPDGLERSGAEADTTNQRMELAAVLDAVRALPGPLHVVSDSTYVVNCFRDNWWKGWLARGWKNSQKKPVANRDLWEPLITEYQKRDVTFEWVKGHSGDRWNDRADELAVAARDGARPEPAVSETPLAEANAEAEVETAHRGQPAGAGYAIAITGMRPPELGGYDENPIAAAVRRRLVAILEAKREMHDGLIVHTGLGLGAETLAAEAAIAAGVPFVAVLAFPDPAARWPTSSRDRYDRLLDQAVDVVITTTTLPASSREAAKAFAARDRKLEADCAEAIIVWDRADRGVGATVRSFESAFGEDVWIVDPAEVSSS